MTPAEVPDTPGVAVHRLGPGDAELRRLYAEADLFCLPTPADAVPWALLEAMASGVPVVATNVGAIPEMVGAGEETAGIVVEPRDIDGLRTAVTSLVEDPLRRADLGERARAICEERFDQRRQAAALAEVVHRVVET